MKKPEKYKFIIKSERDRWGRLIIVREKIDIS